MRELRICLVLEGCYPYVHGGVSTWMHQYITVMKEHEFVLWVIGAHACDRGKFVYELPDNVVEVHEVFLDDALKLKEHGNQGQNHGNNQVCRCKQGNIQQQLAHGSHRNPAIEYETGNPVGTENGPFIISLP